MKSACEQTMKNKNYLGRRIKITSPVKKEIRIYKTKLLQQTNRRQDAKTSSLIIRAREQFDIVKKSMMKRKQNLAPPKGKEYNATTKDINGRPDVKI